MSFEHIFDFFGDFNFARKQGISLSETHGSMILPEYDEMRSEDRIHGIYKDTKIDISETTLITKYKGKKVSIFHGMVILLDVCNVDIKVRAPFDGTTVIIEDKKKNSPLSKRNLLIIAV